MSHGVRFNDGREWVEYINLGTELEIDRINDRYGKGRFSYVPRDYVREGTC